MISGTDIDLAVVGTDLPEKTLDELAEIIRFEHDEVVSSASQMLKHAIRAGEALTIAKRRVEPGGWMSWTASNLPEMRHTLITNYMRIAHYQTKIPKDIDSIAEARRALKGLPDIDGSPRGVTRNGYPLELRETAVKLVSEGMSQELVAEEIGVAQGTVSRWVRGQENSREYWRNWAAKNRLRRRKAHAAREALRREERERKIQKIGGPLAESYSRVRKAAQALQKALEESDDPHVSGHLRLALSKLYVTEDEIVKALRLK